MANPVIKITAVDEASKVINAVSTSLSRLAAPIQAIGALGVSAGLAQFVTFLTDAVKALDDLDEAAQGLGVTAVQLAELRTAAQQGGLGFEQLDRLLVKFNARLTEANAGNKEAIRLFDALGIAFNQGGQQRPLLDAIGEFAEKFSKFENNGRKAAVALALFQEKLGPKAAAFFNQGADGLRVYSGLMQKTVDDAAKLQKQLDTLSVEVTKLKNAFLGEALPGINAFLKALDGVEVSSGLFGNALRLIIKTMKELKKESAGIDLKNTIRPITGPDGLPLYLPPQQQQAPKLPDASQIAALEASRKMADEARREFQKTGLDSYLAKEAAEFKRASAVVDEYNRVLQESVDIREEDRQVGLRSNRENEAADAARARAQLQNFNDELEKSNRLGEDLGLVFESAFSSLITSGQGLTVGSFFKSLAQDIAQVIIKITVLTPLINALKLGLESSGASNWLGLALKAFGGAMASGGSVSSGTPYLVGEKGPEFFVPNVSGTIIPNGGGMGVTVVQNVSIDSRSDVATIRQAMIAAKNEAVREVGDQLSRRGAMARA